MLFRDRTEAGKRLAAQLKEYVGRPGGLVLALPRGGVTTLVRFRSAILPETVDSIVSE